MTGRLLRRTVPIFPAHLNVQHTPVVPADVVPGEQAVKRHSGGGGAEDAHQLTAPPEAGVSRGAARVHHLTDSVRQALREHPLRRPDPTSVRARVYLQGTNGMSENKYWGCGWRGRERGGKEKRERKKERKMRKRGREGGIEGERNLTRRERERERER